MNLERAKKAGELSEEIEQLKPFLELMENRTKDKDAFIGVTVHHKEPTNGTNYKRMEFKNPELFTCLENLIRSRIIQLIKQLEAL